MIALPGWAVIEAEEKRMEGSIELPQSATESMQRGSIVAVNPTYTKEGVSLTSKLAVGNRVVFKKYHDNDLELEGKKYKIVHIDNIMVIL